MEDSQAENELSSNYQRDDIWFEDGYSGFHNNEPLFFDNLPFHWAPHSYYSNTSSQLQNGIAQSWVGQAIEDNYYNNNFHNYSQNNYNFNQSEGQYYQMTNVAQTTFPSIPKTTPFWNSNLAQYYEMQNSVESRAQMVPAGYGYSQGEPFTQNISRRSFTPKDTKNLEGGKMANIASCYPPFNMAFGGKIDCVEQSSAFKTPQSRTNFK